MCCSRDDWKLKINQLHMKNSQAFVKPGHLLLQRRPYVSHYSNKPFQCVNFLWNTVICFRKTVSFKRLRLYNKYTCMKVPSCAANVLVKFNRKPCRGKFLNSGSERNCFKLSKDTKCLPGLRLRLGCREVRFSNVFSMGKMTTFRPDCSKTLPKKILILGI